MRESNWLHFDRELLDEVLSLLAFEGRLVCERTCKQWYSALSCDIQRDLWGDTWTFVNDQHKSLQRKSLQNSYYLVMSIPQSKCASDLYNWVSRRFQSIYQLNLGDCSHPVDLLNDSYAEGLIHNLLAQMKAEEASAHMSLWAKVPSCTVTTRIFDLLPSFCTFMTLGPGLTSVDMERLTRLTRLTELELRFHNSSRSLRLMPMDQLTRLQHLNSLELVFPPRLPASMHSFELLTSLTIAPRAGASVDLRQCKRLLLLCLSPSSARSVPVFLPEGVDCCLHTLDIRASCFFVNLAEAQGLRRVVMSPYYHVFQGIRWPHNISSLQAIDMNKSDEYYKYDNWYVPDRLGLWHLPDAWQNYTSLKRLSLPFFRGESLPDWLPQLQQLRRLDVPYTKIPYFPPCLSQLQNLEHLDLENFMFEGFTFAENVIGLAKLQHLTYLNFGSQPSMRGYQFNTLTQLCLALQTRDSPLLRKACQLGGADNVWTFVKI